MTINDHKQGQTLFTHTTGNASLQDQFSYLFQLCLQSKTCKLGCCAHTRVTRYSNEQDIIFVAIDDYVCL